MTLRTRLFATSLLVALPLAVFTFLVGQQLRAATKHDALRRSVEYDLAHGLADQCAAAPPRGGGPGHGGGRPPGPRAEPRRGPETSGDGPPRPPGDRPSPDAEDATRRPGRGPNRPGDEPGEPYVFYAYDAEGRPTSTGAPTLPERRDAMVANTYWSGTGLGASLLVPLGSNGRCAFLLARIPPPPGELRDQLEAFTLVVFSVLAAAWLSAGPIISSLTRLRAGVRQSSASHYVDPVAAEGAEEVAAVAQAFNDAGRQVRAHLDELREREQTLRDFVANTTHDVAIPLTVLQGHLAELDRQLDADSLRNHVRAAVAEAHYMGSLLRNLGAATRLDAEGIPVAPSPVDLSALLDRVVARHQPIARASAVELNFAVPEAPVVVVADHTLLEQAVSNLVDNAIRYNRPGGHVAVVLDVTGAAFSITVTDDGPGVAADELSKLATRWFRGSDARTRRPDGKGLGLAIASESLARLGFSLRFEQPCGGGLTARVSGPMAPAEQQK